MGHYAENLSPDQVHTYERDGFLLLRGAVDDADICTLERGLRNNPPLHGTLGEIPDYPAPGRYTLANNALADPDLIGIVEHPIITAAAAQLLHADPRLSAYVIYDRTPGGPGIPAHHDYKRWRPVGSSMNWLFTIVPFCDFDEHTGPLYVAPGSHLLERIAAGSERVLEVAPPPQPKADDFIDPGLKRGDLLLMNMHLWHRASGNSSERHRAGIFNKYAAANAPPATGYFLYNNEVYNALQPQNRHLLAVHSERSIRTTRLLLTRRRDAVQELLLLPNATGKFELPGGATETETAIADWDEGNYIASLQHHVRSQIAIEAPWMSYIGDFEEQEHLCRVYAYELTGRGFPVTYDPAHWCTAAALAQAPLQYGYESAALAAWNDTSIVRGKGLSQAQSRTDQFAY
jgi:hypothetical protein